MDLIHFGGQRYFSHIHRGVLHYILPENLSSFKDSCITERMESCGKFMRATIKCPDCEAVHAVREVETHCFLRYGSCCSTTRYKRALSRLLSYNIHSERLVHAVIGFPHESEHHREHKQHQEKVIKAFISNCEKKGHSFKGLKVFDYQDKQHPYAHYHLALLPMNLRFREVQAIVRDTIKETGQKFVFHSFGYKPYRALMHYFAKRIAGLYGDWGKEVRYIAKNGHTVALRYAFTLKDRISVKQFRRNFYRMTVLTKISRRIACNNVPFCSDHICQCGCTRLSVSFILINPVYQVDMETTATVPPPIIAVPRRQLFEQPIAL
jgi:hypothetical protein